VNEWVNLVVIHPETRVLYRFVRGEFTIYTPLQTQLGVVHDVQPLAETEADNLPVLVLE
jgi:uncharacterized protein